MGKMKCECCGYMDYSIAYLTNPPQYKCERYGCMVKMDSTCKGDTNAEKQEQEKASQ